MSQLELAVEAKTTPRYVSFIETGRSRPGPELVVRLAEAMDVPIRERNALLAAAGLPPAYAEHELHADAMAAVQGLLDRVLENHEPYPAWAVARGFRFLAANAAAQRLMPGLVGAPPQKIVDMMFGPGPFRERVENWREVMWAGIAGLRREQLRSPDPIVEEMLRRAEAHAEGIRRPDGIAESPVICPVFKVGDRRVRTVSAVMRLETAVEVTTSELRIELMYPADAEAAAFFEQLGQGDVP